MLWVSFPSLNEFAQRVLNTKTDVFNSSKIDCFSPGENTCTLNMYIKTGLCRLHALSSCI